MIILAQASDGGTGIFLALFIAIALFALAAWGTHWIWYFRSFGMFARGISPHYFLGVIGLVRDSVAGAPRAEAHGERAEPRAQRLSRQRGHESGVDSAAEEGGHGHVSEQVLLHRAR